MNKELVTKRIKRKLEGREGGSQASQTHHTPSTTGEDVFEVKVLEEAVVNVDTHGLDRAELSSAWCLLASVADLDGAVEGSVERASLVLAALWNVEGSRFSGNESSTTRCFLRLGVAGVMPSKAHSFVLRCFFDMALRGRLCVRAESRCVS